ncbi:TPA: hypothetical protein ENG04_11595 [Candidatus Poribacteria bacterium]|nr:hypothetical protein [Candidatus Poribacteria bacterium]HEX30711.1 hypothetical protein [Candidatus Poribacteria bacterium]
MLRALSTWLYDGDPLALVAFERPLEMVKALWSENPPYFEGLIRDHMLGNPHRATLKLLPDPELLKRLEAEERRWLERTKAMMSPAELEALLESTLRSRELQEVTVTSETSVVLPTLRRVDLTPEVLRIPLEISEEAQTHVLYHPLTTNSILYLDLGFDLRVLPQDLLPYATVFGQLLLEIDPNLARRISGLAGGIHVRILASEAKGDMPGPIWLFLRGKTMADKADELLSILHDMLSAVNFDNPERFSRIARRERARREAEMWRGSRMLNLRLRAHFSEAAWVDDQLTGIGSLPSLDRMIREAETDWPSVLERLETLRTALVNRNAMLINITLDPPSCSRFRPLLTSFLEDLPISPVDRAHWSLSELPTKEGFIIPSEVNYVGKGADLFRLGYTLHGSIFAIVRYLNMSWLWSKVREEGGAYGVYAMFDHLSGVFTFLSLHDPHLVQTLNVYDGTGDFLRHSTLSEDELMGSVIGAVGELERFQSTSDQGFISMARYLTGEDDETRQRLLEELLSTTSAHFKEFADILDALRREGYTVILADEERLRRAGLPPHHLSNVKL